MRGFLDLDGVIANWRLAISKALSLDYALTFEREYFEEEEINEPMEKFSFWADMEPYSWSEDLVETFDEGFEGNWVFLTKGWTSKESFSGKYEWVLKNYPKHFSKLVIVRSKEFHCCLPTDYLLDDDSRNLNPWASRGGTPLPWDEIYDDDRGREIAKKRIEILKDFLKSERAKNRLQ